MDNLRGLVRYIIGLIAVATILTSCQEKFQKKLHEPWSDSRNVLVIDAYHQNTLDWQQLSQATRVVGIIHKATQGFSIDPQYHVRKTEAKKRGYLWGSYHLGVSGDPEKQAEFYLRTIQPNKDEVLALDLESVKGSRYMSIAEAERFIQRIYKKTGRYPLVYGNHRVIAEISKQGSESVFSQTPLWYARFRKNIPDFPGGTWPSYTLWQFSSELNVQIRIPGTRKDIDVNIFYGTRDDIKKHWPFS
jgi:GH25 family lysozyme M1 (1,4-beta-N-acetylmuramidase)